MREQARIQSETILSPLVEEDNHTMRLQPHLRTVNDLAEVEIENLAPTEKSPLSKKQHRVLDLESRGLTKSDVAGEMGIEFETVRNHFKSMIAKLGAVNSAEATRIALEAGWLDTLEFPPDGPPREPLTSRQLEMFGSLAYGLSTEEIARRLYITPQTVKSHIKSLYENLNAKGRSHAVRLGYSLGLKPEPPAEVVERVQAPIPDFLPHSTNLRQNRQAPANEEADDFYENPNIPDRLAAAEKITRPTDQWHEPFFKKVEEAKRFMDTHHIDSQSHDRIRKLLIENSLLQIGETDPTALSKHDIITGLLFVQKSTSRFLISDKTAEVAISIIRTGQIPPREQKRRSAL